MRPRDVDDRGQAQDADVPERLERLPLYVLAPAVRHQRRQKLHRLRGRCELAELFDGGALHVRIRIIRRDGLEQSDCVGSGKVFGERLHRCAPYIRAPMIARDLAESRQPTPIRQLAEGFHGRPLHIFIAITLRDRDERGVRAIIGFLTQPLDRRAACVGITGRLRDGDAGIDRRWKRVVSQRLGRTPAHVTGRIIAGARAQGSYRGGRGMKAQPFRGLLPHAVRFATREQPHEQRHDDVAGSVNTERRDDILAQIRIRCPSKQILDDRQALCLRGGSEPEQRATAEVHRQVGARHMHARQHRLTALIGEAE